MNKVTLMGRLTRNPEITISQSGTKVARYTLAVRRSVKKEGQPEADFINCVCFGKGAEFAETYLRQGMQIAVCGRIHTSSYKNKDDKTIYSVDVIVEEHFFAEGKKNAGKEKNSPETDKDGFMQVPEG